MYILYQIIMGVLLFTIIAGSLFCQSQSKEAFRQKAQKEIANFPEKT